MSKALPREWKKWDTNSDPQSEVIWEGTPCLEKTWRRNNFCQSGGVDSVMRGDEYALLGQAIHDDKDGGESG